MSIKMATHKPALWYFCAFGFQQNLDRARTNGLDYSQKCVVL